MVRWIINKTSNNWELEAQRSYKMYKFWVIKLSVKEYLQIKLIKLRFKQISVGSS